MNIDQELQMRWSGRDPGTGGWATYLAVNARGRNAWGTLDSKVPFAVDFGAGPQVKAIAMYDQIACIDEVTAWRHIDPNGEQVNMMKVMLYLWYWLLDGAPTPITAEKRKQYIDQAKVYRPWPTGWAGAQAFPSEPTQNYSAS